MKQVYPIVISPGSKYLIVDIPDFNITTQGETVTEAIEMAMDAIGSVGIVREDRNLPFPAPTPLQDVVTENPDDIVTLVLVDFTAYRRKVDSHIVRKNCSLPSWLNVEAEKAGVNFSALLQSALKAELNIS